MSHTATSTERLAGTDAKRADADRDGPARVRPRRTADDRRAGGERQHSGPRRFSWFAPLRWLRRKLSGVVRWVSDRLRGPLRPIARIIGLRWLANHLPPPLSWLAKLFARPESERGFGFWWLVVTLGIAAAVGLVVAVLISPVAGIIALPVVAIMALVRRRRDKPEADAKGDGKSERRPVSASPSPVAA